MIQTSPGRWLHKRDLVHDIPGRRDEADVTDGCWDFLEATYSDDAERATRASKATNELLAAKLRSRTRSRQSPAELLARIEAQQRTIDRLLAFVPTRAHLITGERLSEITGEVREAAVKLFDPARVIVRATNEPDTDTTACHRIAVEVAYGDDFDPGVFAVNVFELQRTVAASLTPEEFEAVRLIVDVA